MNKVGTPDLKGELSTPAKSTFFTVAAWYALLAPMLAAILVGIGQMIGDPSDRHANQPADVAFGAAFCVLITALLAGITSLFGVPKRRAQGIGWKLFVGFIIGCCVFWKLQYIGMLEAARQ